MKNLLFVFLLVFPLFNFAQEYSEVVQVEGKTVEQLYTSAREWFAVTFNSANDVLQMEDPSAGKLIGKGSAHLSESYVSGKGLTAIPTSLDWLSNFTIKVEIREGRYKCSISDVIIKTTIPLIGVVEQPFKTYLDNFEKYQKGCDPDWIINNSPEGIKIGKSSALTMVQANKAICKLISKTDDNLKSIMRSLEDAMKKSSGDDW
ncbi:MAG: DUF4468 domain-containing protein [Bacteroidia bacterium]|nr:DUF4468 domain-containing protein [Bacteroidia bacterium]